MAGVGMAEKAADFELDGVATAARTAAQVDSERGDVSGARDGLARQAPPGVVLAFGMHLCGALSPRLLSLGAHLECISAFSVCPCCIKGSLGDYGVPHRRTTALEPSRTPGTRGQPAGRDLT
jgi:hypothetical protein